MFLAVAVGGVIVLAVIKKDAPVYAAVAECAVITAIIIAAVPQLKSLYESVSGLLGAAQTGTSDVLTVLVKSFAVLGAGEICADICRDNSQNAIASVVGFCSKLAALLCAMPLMSGVFEVALTFLNK